MYNDLIVITFTRQEEALLAWIGLDMMRNRQLMGVDKATAVIKDELGRTTIHQSWDLGIYPPSEETKVLHQLARTIFSSDTPKGQADLAEAGLDQLFLKNVVAALKTDSSALLFFIPQESLIDTNELLKILKKMRGIVHHTTFPASLTGAILEQR